MSSLFVSFLRMKRHIAGYISKTDIHASCKRTVLYNFQSSLRYVLGLNGLLWVERTGSVVATKRQSTSVMWFAAQFCFGNRTDRGPSCVAPTKVVIFCPRSVFMYRTPKSVFAPAHTVFAHNFYLFIFLLFCWCWCCFGCSNIF